jgi:DnaJ like chaperone protein
LIESKGDVMGWFGKLTFGSLGLLLGGPLGAIAGAALGHHLVDRRSDLAQQRINSGQGPGFGRVEQTQAAYFISLFSILGKLSKIDGAVTRDEIALVQAFIDSLPIGDGEKQFARQVFNEAKESPYAIEDFATQLFQAAKNQPPLLDSFYNLLFQLAAADGKFHSAEETALKKIQAIFNISDKQYEDIKAVYFKNTDKDCRR